MNIHVDMIRIHSYLSKQLSKKFYNLQGVPEKPCRESCRKSYQILHKLNCKRKVAKCETVNPKRPGLKKLKKS